MLCSVPLFGRRRVDEGVLVGYETVHDRRDRRVLNKLVDHGADLTLPRHVLHHMFFYTKIDQREAAAAAGGFGWEIATRHPLPDSPNRWAVVAHKYGVVLTATEILNDRSAFEAIAARFAGKYDGWETLL